MATKQRPAPTRPKISDPAPGTTLKGGRTRTVGDTVVQQIDAGVDPFTAAAAVGVSAAEFSGWMREGQLVMSRLNSGADWRVDFTADQQDSYLFAERVVAAVAIHVARLTRIAEQAARGELTRKHTRSRRVGRKVVEVIETVEQLLPDRDLLKWKLEHHAPNVYGQRATLNVVAVDLTDTPEVAATISHRMQQIAKALLEQRAIEAGATEVEVGDAGV